jgi:putative SOS response-associated peptidase YedK
MLEGGQATTTEACGSTSEPSERKSEIGAAEKEGKTDGTYRRLIFQGKHDMCANYLPSRPERLQQYFYVAAPDSEYRDETYPGYMAPLIRRPDTSSDELGRSAALGMFGLVPHWADEKLSRQTYNARTETVASKPSFRNAFKKGQFCIIPSDAIYEPSYESGKPVRWRIEHAEGVPLGIAGIWEYKADGPTGLPLLSFSMLTINADDHPLMRRFHRPVDEKRMVVIVRPDEFDAWLSSDAVGAASFFKEFPAEELIARPEPKVAARSTQKSLL